MNLTLQHRNIDFDSQIQGRFPVTDTSGGCLAQKTTSALPRSWRFILSIWIPVWIFFLVWPLRKAPSKLVSTFKVMGADAEVRQARAFGEEFHTFLRFCKDRLPAGSTFRLVGIDYASIDKVRAFYFLYPCLVAEQAQFILVYKSPDYREDNTHLYALLSPGNFILKSTQSEIP